MVWGHLETAIDISAVVLLRQATPQDVLELRILILVLIGDELCSVSCMLGFGSGDTG